MNGAASTYLRVLAGIGNRPEPEFVKHTGANKEKAGQRVRQNYSRGEHKQALEKWPRSPVIPHDAQHAEDNEEDAVLLHQKRDAESNAAGKQQPCSAGTQRVQHEQDANECGKNDEVCGVCFETHDRRARRKQGITAGRDYRRQSSEQNGREPVQQQRGCRVDQKQTGVNGRGRFAENGEHHRVRGIDAGQLHVVRQPVGWDALEHELPRVGVFAFIALKWHRSQAITHHPEQNDHKQHQPHGERRGHSQQKSRPTCFANILQVGSFGRLRHDAVASNVSSAPDIESLGQPHCIEAASRSGAAS